MSNVKQIKDKIQILNKNVPTTPFSFFSPILPTPLQLRKQVLLQQNIKFCAIFNWN